MFVPEGYRNVKDMFSFVLASAPDFPNPPTKHPLTLEEVIGGLLEGIDQTSKKTMKEDALKLFAASAEQVRETDRLYREGDLRTARRLIQEARDTFAAAGKAARAGGKRPQEWAEKR